MAASLAIVSSYDELCGNATYTEALRRELSKHYNVTVFPLDVKLLNRAERRTMKLAESHIDDISRKLTSFDYVNIQFEAGLYGAYPHHILDRAERLIRSSKNVVITMHRIDLPLSILDKKYIKLALSGKVYEASKAFKAESYFAGIYSRLMGFLRTELDERRINVVVHTPREKWNVEHVFGFPKVYDHPITFLNRDQRMTYPSKFNGKAFRTRYGVRDGETVIGIFGFLNTNKGHETAIRALAYLPDDYTLLICGSQHPTTIRTNTPVDDYIKKLIELVEEGGGRKESRSWASRETDRRPLPERVRFVGELGDEEFIEALYCCDMTVLPYIETNQSGSGIAALSLETHAHSIFSRNYAFMELARYYPGAFPTFDIGNHLELAHKILNYQPVYEDALSRGLERLNMETNIRMYRKLFEGREDV